MPELFDILTSQTPEVFSADVPFSRLATSHASTSVASVITFTIASGPKIPGSQAIYRLVPQTDDVPDFSNFKQVNGTATYDNRVGIVNVITFFYDGVDHWYSIFQEAGAVPVDIVAPTISALLSTVGLQEITLTYDEDIDETSVPAPGDFTLSNGTVTNVSITNETFTLTTSAAFADGDTLAYTPGTNPIRDLSGNNAAAVPATAITVNGALELLFDSILGDITKDGTVYRTPTPDAATDRMAGATFIPANEDGWISYDFVSQGGAEGNNTNVFVGLDQADGATGNSIMDFYCWIAGDQTVRRRSQGVSDDGTYTLQSASIGGAVRIGRFGGVVQVHTSPDKVNWTPIYDLPNGTVSTPLYAKINFSLGDALHNPKIFGGVDKA